MQHTDTILTMLADAGQAALAAAGPEEALHQIARHYFEVLGDREAEHRPGALKPGEKQYFIAGAFIVTPDRRHHMLVGNVGFPPEQRRLMVPIDGGHPGWVYANRSDLLLENTDDHGTFKQYLKTSRMGSTIFAPMIWKGDFLGQMVMAAQARHTMRQADLDVLKVAARIATGAWVAHGGPAWLEAEFPPADAFYVDREGVS